MPNKVLVLGVTVEVVSGLSTEDWSSDNLLVGQLGGHVVEFSLLNFSGTISIQADVLIENCNEEQSEPQKLNTPEEAVQSNCAEEETNKVRFGGKINVQIETWQHYTKEKQF